MVPDLTELNKAVNKLNADVDNLVQMQDNTQQEVNGITTKILAIDQKIVDLTVTTI